MQIRKLSKIMYKLRAFGLRVAAGVCGGGRKEFRGGAIYISLARKFVAEK